MGPDIDVCVGVGAEEEAYRVFVGANPRMGVLWRLRRRDSATFDGEDRSSFTSGTEFVLDVVQITKVHTAIRWNRLRWKAGKDIRDGG